ncbi:ectoine hydrolase [Bradyrhizobium sp. GM2.2]|uniref:aminopeptidase P family N-terminal domain-containing protein n=1 Tax=Bradyrhizobium sp. GM2.2 TaxID=3156358 RepID=UPI00339485A7
MTITKGPQVVPRAEYLRRLAAVKFELVERGVEVPVVNSDRNVNYLMGYMARPAYVPQGLIVSVHTEEPTLVLREITLSAGIHLTFLVHDNIIGYPETFVGDLEKDAYDTAIYFIRDAGLANRDLGLELGRLPVRSAEKSKAQLPQARGVAAQVPPRCRKARRHLRNLGALARGVDRKCRTGISNVCMCSLPLSGTSHITWRNEASSGSEINLGRRVCRTPIRPSCRPLRSATRPIASRGGVRGARGRLEQCTPRATCVDIAETSTMKDHLRWHAERLALNKAA